MTDIAPPKCAIVTGAATGLGNGIALRLLSDGWCVLATDLNADVDDRFGPGTFDGRVRTAVADVSDPRTAEALVRSAMASFGRIDALINNAGIGARAATSTRSRSTTSSTPSTSTCSAWCGCARPSSRTSRRRARAASSTSARSTPSVPSSG